MPSRSKHTLETGSPQQLSRSSASRPDTEGTPSKRRKPNPPASPSNTLALSDMYNFSKPNHIDLTGNGPARMTTVPKKSLGMARSTDTPADAAPKKLVVKHLRQKSRSDPDKYYNQVRSQVDAAVAAILADEKVPYSNEELYRGIENLCKQGRAAPLFKSLCEQCKKGIASQFGTPLVAEASTLNDVELLRAVIEAWNAWNLRLKMIRSIFFFLDRSYLLHSSSLPSIEEMGTDEFRNLVFSQPALKPRILNGTCDLIAADRLGEAQKPSETFRGHVGTLMNTTIKMFHSMGVYTSDFEPELLGRSSEYFAAWSDEKADGLDLAHYIEASQTLIDSEMRRCDNLGLDSTTRKTLEVYLEDLLIDQGDRQEILLGTAGVSQLLQTDDTQALKQLYSLLQRRDLCGKLRTPFEAYIIDQGSGIVFDEAREQEMVVRLLDFKKKLDTIWKQSFALHEGLGHTLREAFEAFINKTKRSNMTWGTDNPKPGEMIAKHVDMVLKGGLKMLSSDAATGKPDNQEDGGASSEDEELEIGRQLGNVLELFRFVHGKAVFEAFYKRDLARRLLLNRSASADAEKSMLTRLKSECGATFTLNLEQMFKDMELAREEVTSYKSMLEQRGGKPVVDLNVSVLSASAWPSYPDVPLTIPPEVQQQATQFEQYYNLKHTGRRLTWKHSLAHCQLKANLPKGGKEFVVSSYQAVVLLLFKNKPANEEVPYGHIQAACGLDDMELKRTLQSLACARYRPLSKTPKGKEVNNTDTFSVNENFSDPKYRIKINQIQAKETKEENKETHERVAADRAYETQAAIVRIMKARKSVTHNDLVTEVINATKNRGALEIADIKKNIEKLIEKDYMERTETDDGRRNVYSYVA